MSLEPYEKERIALRYWLLGRGYTAAARAMTFAQGYHTGIRKDQVTPEFAHQVRIANYVRTLASGLLRPEATLATVFLHDVREDYDVDDAVIASKFGREIADATWLLTKKFRGQAKDPATLFADMARNPIASVVKGADRVHNFHSMVGVFSREKQLSYIEECEAFILPMLKEARRSIPEQEPAYENLKHILLEQIGLVRAIHQAAA